MTGCGLKQQKRARLALCERGPKVELVSATARPETQKRGKEPRRKEKSPPPRVISRGTFHMEGLSRRRCSLRFIASPIFSLGKVGL